MLDSTHLTETLIYRYISDHGLCEGDRLESPEQLAAMFGQKAPAVESALDAACRSGVLVRGATGDVVVKSLQAMPGQEWLSFTHSAALHGEEVKTIVREARLRPPLVDPEDPIATEFDRSAHQSLRLKEGEPFIVISRVRWLTSASGDDPRVIHRAYLDPKRFPANFLSDHDFARESLVRIYNSYGYAVHSRLDAARARLACIAERSDLKLGLHEPVLDVAQRTIATAQNAEAPFVLEYLRATYWNLTFEFER